MFSKRYESTIVDHRTWLHGPPAVTLNKLLRYKKETSAKIIHHFKSDLINNIDHMRISGIEPYSLSHIVQITVLFLDFLHEYCEEKFETFTQF